jgi:hypothetical protein
MPCLPQKSAPKRRRVPKAAVPRKHGPASEQTSRAGRSASGSVRRGPPTSRHARITPVAWRAHAGAARQSTVREHSRAECLRSSGTFPQLPPNAGVTTVFKPLPDPLEVVLRSNLQNRCSGIPRNEYPGTPELRCSGILRNTPEYRRSEMIRINRKKSWTTACALSFTVGWWKESVSMLGQLNCGVSRFIPEARPSGCGGWSRE